jgi:hypothetical protein
MRRGARSPAPHARVQDRFRYPRQRSVLHVYSCAADPCHARSCRVQRDAELVPLVAVTRIQGGIHLVLKDTVSSVWCIADGEDAPSAGLGPGGIGLAGGSSGDRLPAHPPAGSLADRRLVVSTFSWSRVPVPASIAGPAVGGNGRSQSLRRGLARTLSRGQPAGPACWTCLPVLTSAVARWGGSAAR